MEVIEWTLEDFFHFDIKSHCFNSPQFLKQVCSKTDSIKILAFKNTKVKMVIALGLSEQIARSPFSAPFGGFVPISNTIAIEEIDEVVLALIDWINKKNIKKLIITQPPDIYDQSMNSKIHNSLIRNGFNISNFELNFHFKLTDFNFDYFINNVLWRNGRKNLKIALKSQLNFRRVEGIERQEAYNIILKNRTERGYELKLDYAELEETSKFIDMEFFLIEKDHLPIAAAVVYIVKSNIALVVYWGSILKYQDYKPINFLSLRLIEYYLKQGIDILDIGPSSINSFPDYGLCNFKESIGCNISLKNTYTFG